MIKIIYWLGKYITSSQAYNVPSRDQGRGFERQKSEYHTKFRLLKYIWSQYTVVAPKSDKNLNSDTFSDWRKCHYQEKNGFKHLLVKKLV